MRARGGDSTPESCAGEEETAHQNHVRGGRRQHTRIMRGGGGDSTPESCGQVEETAHQNHARGWRRQHTRIMREEEETAHQNRARGWRRQHTRIVRGGGGDSTPESWAKHSCSESRRNCLAIDTPWTQHPSRAVTSAPKFVNRTWPFVLPHRRRVAARSIATRVWATDKTGPGTVH